MSEPNDGDSPTRSNAVYGLICKVKENAKRRQHPELTHADCLLLFDELDRLWRRARRLEAENAALRAWLTILEDVT